MKITPTRIAATGIAAALGSLAIAAPSFAADDPTLAPMATAMAQELGAENQSSHSDESPAPGLDGACAVDFGIWEPTTEEIAEINAETDDLIAHLADNGITVDVETDDQGVRFPAFDHTTDDAVWDLVDDFFADRYGDEPFGLEAGEIDGLEGCDEELIAELEACGDHVFVDELAREDVSNPVDTDEAGADEE